MSYDYNPFGTITTPPQPQKWQQPSTPSSDCLLVRRIRLSWRIHHKDIANTLWVELGAKAWENARPSPKIIRIALKKNFGTIPFGARALYSTSPIPPLVHACFESRAYALKHWYTQNQQSWAAGFIGQVRINEILTFYMDPVRDYAYLGRPEDNTNDMGSISDSLLLWPPQIVATAESLVASRSFVTGDHGLDFLTALIHFKKSKRVVLLNPDCMMCIPSMVLTLSDLEMSDLTVCNVEFYMWWAEEKERQLRQTPHKLQLLEIDPEKPSFGSEEVVCMELDVTDRTTKICGGFLRFNFDYHPDILMWHMFLGKRVPGVSPTEARQMDCGRARGKYDRRSKPERKSTSKWQQGIDRKVDKMLQESHDREETLRLQREYPEIFGHINFAPVQDLRLNDWTSLSISVLPLPHIPAQDVSQALDHMDATLESWLETVAADQIENPLPGDIKSSRSKNSRLLTVREKTLVARLKRKLKAFF